MIQRAVNFGFEQVRLRIDNCSEDSERLQDVSRLIH